MVQPQPLHGSEPSAATQVDAAVLESSEVSDPVKIVGSDAAAYRPSARRQRGIRCGSSRTTCLIRHQLPTGQMTRHVCEVS